MIRRTIFADNSGIVGLIDGLGGLKGVGVGVSEGGGEMVGLGDDVDACFKTNQVHVPTSNPLLICPFGTA